MAFSCHQLLCSQRVLSGAAGSRCEVGFAEYVSAVALFLNKMQSWQTPGQLKAVQVEDAQPGYFHLPAFFLKPMWWVWSCIQRAPNPALPCTHSSRFGPRMDFTNQIIKYPAKSILLRPKHIVMWCLDIWINGIPLSRKSKLFCNQILWLLWWILGEEGGSAFLF